MVDRYVLAVGCVVLGVFLTACQQLPLPGQSGASVASKEGGRAAQAVLVSTSVAQEGDIANVLTYPGTVQPPAQVPIAPRTVGRVEKINVDVGDSVKAGDVLAEMERSSLQAQVAQAEANLAAARARLETVLAGSRPEEVQAAEAQVASARARLAQVRNGATPSDLSAAQAAVAQAEANLAAAEQRLADLKARPKPEDVRAAELAVEQARDSLWAAQIDRDAACGRGSGEPACRSGNAKVAAAETAVSQALVRLEQAKQPPKPEEVKAAETALGAARAQLDSARARLDQLQRGPTPEDIAIAESAVVQAESQLALKRTPYTDRDIETARAQVAQAEAALAAATAASQDVILTAPFDGIVAQRFLNPGAIASQSSPVLTLVPKAVEVTINVEENRVSLLKPDLSVELMAPAAPGQVIPGRIASIAPTADAKTRNFVVKIATDGADGLLKPGMSADVRITAERRSNAVLVPKEAVVQRQGKSLVFVAADGRAVAREVQLGLSDLKNVEVLKGVNPGEQVIVSGHAALNDGDAIRLPGPGPGGSSQPGSGPAQKPTGPGGRPQQKSGGQGPGGQ